ncbi:MAG: hypothetical protein AAFQ57_12635 [Cyanobacteria bacterium J06626_14]
MFELLMEQGAVRRNGSGHPRIHPKRVEADKDYTGEPIKEKSALQILSSQSGIRAR